MNNRLWTRRETLRSGAALGLLGAGLSGAGGLASRAFAQSGFDWKRFEGAEIDVVMTRSPRAELFQQSLDEFRELTGIRASLELIPEQQYRQKLVIEFASGRPTFDVAELTLTVQKRLAGKGNWFADLRPLLDDASLTAPDFDFADFGRGAVEAATQSDGKLDTLPIALDYFLLYYNKELFAAKNVALPTSMDDMVRAAAEIHDPASGVSGFVSRGLKNANVPVWMSFLFGQGSDAISRDGALQTTSPEAVWAAKLYKTLNVDYGPTGVVGFNWNECLSTFSQGFAGMWLDSTGFASLLEDPANSPLAGKVGYMPVPPGPKSQAAAVFASGVGIASASQKQEAAWYFLQWVDSKENQSRLLASGKGAPARLSPFKDPAVTAAAPLPPEFYGALEHMTENSYPALPNIVPVSEFRDIFGIALANMLTGADEAAELETATQAFRPVLERSER